MIRVCVGWGWEVEGDVDRVKQRECDNGVCLACVRVR